MSALLSDPALATGAAVPVVVQRSRGYWASVAARFVATRRRARRFAVVAVMLAFAVFARAGAARPVRASMLGA